MEKRTPVYYSNIIINQNHTHRFLIIFFSNDEIGLEGRAGMATIVDETNSLDLDHLHSALQKSLPAYAKPLFIRIKKSVDTTGMFFFKPKFMI